MSGSVYFSTIDLSASFFQDPIVSELDHHKTAFITRKGQFRFTSMPQGCANSPSMFSRVMYMVLIGLTWITCLVYIDDTIMIGRTFDEAYNNVQEVLNRFR